MSVFVSWAWILPARRTVVDLAQEVALEESASDTLQKTGRRPRYKPKDRPTNSFVNPTAASPFVPKNTTQTEF